MSSVQLIDKLLIWLDNSSFLSSSEIEEKCCDNLSSAIQIILPTCFLIKNVLSISEQINLYNAIIKSSQISGININKLNRKKNNNNLININTNDKNHEKQLSNVYFDCINKIVQFINDNIHSKGIKVDFPKGNDYKFNNIKAKQYNAPNGNIFNHCDTQNGWVILLSIGCTPNFYVQHKQLLTNDIKVDFMSGSVIVFDSSKKAGIFHRIDSIQNNTCPHELAQQCPRLKQCRIGLQVRLRGFSTVPNPRDRQQLK